MKRLALVVLMLAFAAQAFAQGAIIVVRHAERVSEKDDALSNVGLQRAQCLASTLNVADIKSVIVTQFHRTQQTAEPTAKSHGVQEQIVTADQISKIADDARRAAHSGDVLIVGHGDTVANIVKALSAKTVTLAPTDYDRMFVVQGDSVTQLRYCPAAQPGPAVKMMR